MNHQDLGRSLMPDATESEQLRLARSLDGPRFRSLSRISGIGDALSEGSPIVEPMHAMFAHLLGIERVGSRVTCSPAPTDTDDDWLVLLKPVAKGVKDYGPEDAPIAALRAIGFEMDRRTPFYTGNDAGGFRSWRRGEVNIIVTRDPAFYELFLTATELARRFNLLEKADRIALFQAVLYGVSVHNLETPPAKPVLMPLPDFLAEPLPLP
jgi:hypothetical protein